MDLKALKRLRTLDLRGNALGALAPGLLPTNLTELDLSNTGLRRFSWSEGLDFPQLGQLKLGGNRGLQIDEAWGDVFLMQRLLALEHDSDVKVPKGWRIKLEKTCAGKDDASPRVLRGGSWHFVPYVCRAAYRYYDAPDYRHYFIGFRVVRVVSARTH